MSSYFNCYCKLSFLCIDSACASPRCGLFHFCHLNKIADYCRPEPPCAAANDPVVKAIMDCCDRLYHLIRQWNSEHSSSGGAGAITSSSSSSSGGQEVGPWGGGGEGEEEVHASGCVPSDVRQLIVSWLSNRRMVGAIIDLWCHAAS